MKEYCWSGINQFGIKHKGVVLATCQENVQKLLLDQHIALISCKEKKQFLPAELLILSRTQKIKDFDLLTFFDQLAMLIDHGLQLSQALTILRNNTSHKKLQNVIISLHTQVQQGSSFSDALSTCKEIQRPMLHIIQTGEMAGALSQSLKQIADILEQRITLKNTINKAMRMPLFTLAFACIVILSLVAFVIPEFASLFKSLDKPLPAATRAVIAFSQFITSAKTLFWLLAGTLITGSLIAFLRKNPLIKKVEETIILQSPLFGPIKKLSYAITILNLTNTLLRAGIPLKRTFQILKKTNTSAFLATHLDACLHDLEQGLSLHTCFGQHLSSIFPESTIAMIHVGEQTGKLNDMLEKTSALLYKNLLKRLEVLTTIIQPILFIAVGLIVIFMMASVYLPIFHMAEII